MREPFSSTGNPSGQLLDTSPSAARQAGHIWALFNIIVPEVDLNAAVVA